MWMLTLVYASLWALELKRHAPLPMWADKITTSLRMGNRPTPLSSCCTHRPPTLEWIHRPWLVSPSPRRRRVARFWRDWMFVWFDGSFWRCLPLQSAAQWSMAFDSSLLGDPRPGQSILFHHHSWVLRPVWINQSQLLAGLEVSLN